MSSAWAQENSYTQHTGNRHSTAGFGSAAAMVLGMEGLMRTPAFAAFGLHQAFFMDDLPSKPLANDWSSDFLNRHIGPERINTRRDVRSEVFN